MSKNTPALEYAAILAESLSDLGYGTSFLIEHDYPNWAGFMSVWPNCQSDSGIEQQDMPFTTDVYPTDSGKITVRCSISVRSDALAFTEDGTALSEADDLRLSAILNGSEYGIKPVCENGRLSLRHSFVFFMGSRSRPAAKKAASVIKERLRGLNSELCRILAQAELEPLPVDPDRYGQMKAVDNAEDIELLFRMQAEEMRMAKLLTASRGELYLSEWDDSWGNPSEIMLQGLEEYNSTGSEYARTMYTVAVDYLSGLFNGYSRIKK